MAAVFDHCCGCIELRKGCLIIAYLILVFTILMLLLSPVAITYGYITMTFNSDSDDISYIIGYFTVIAFSVIIVVSLLQLAYTIVLLIGLHQHKRGYVQSYLIFAAVSLAFFVTGLLLSTFVFYADIRSICEKFIAFSIALYQFLIIRSYYIKMGEDIKPIKGYNLS